MFRSIGGIFTSFGSVDEPISDASTQPADGGAGQDGDSAVYGSTSSGSAQVDSWIPDYDDSATDGQTAGSDSTDAVSTASSSNPNNDDSQMAAQADIVRCPAGTRAVGFSFLPNDYGMEQLKVSVSP